MAFGDGLVLLGLAGCTAMDVISILRKKRQHVTGFEVQAHAERAEEHPKVFTDVTIRYIVEGINIDPAAVMRAIELSETKYCPAQAMLVQAVPIKHEYEIVEVAAGRRSRPAFGRVGRKFRYRGNGCHLSCLTGCI